MNDWVKFGLLADLVICDLGVKGVENRETPKIISEKQKFKPKMWVLVFADRNFS